MFTLEIELNPMDEMISSSTWNKLDSEFTEFDLVEDTSEDTNKNRFIIDLMEGIEYDIK